MSSVETEKLDVRYGRSDVLKGVTLDLRPGEVLVILGMNGSGKSTLLKAMLSLLPAAGGRVRHFGAEPSVQTRRRIGVVFDEPVHWDRLTGWENAYFFARSYGLSKEETNERLGPLFEWSGLSKKKDQPASTYSYGMRRKLSMIEALAHRPEALLMDEPTMGLDYISLRALNQALRRMAKEGGSVLITTNDLAEASEVADRVGVLDHGRLLVIDTPDRLLSSLDRVTQIDLRLQRPIDTTGLDGIEGVSGVVSESEERTVHIYVRSDGQRPETVLARIVAHLDDGGARIENISVRRPDLGYLLTELDRRDRASI